MDTTQIRQFLTICECGKITTASEKIGVTQSTLSRSMQRLEEECGRPLFERSQSGSQLTQWGQQFLPVARRIAGLYDDFLAEAREKDQSGSVRLGVLPTINPYFLPERLASFRDAFPGVHVRVREDTTENLLSGLRHGEIDIAVMAEPIDSRHLDVTPLLNEKLVLICSDKSTIADDPSPSFEEIEKQPFILLYEIHCLNKAIMDLCDERPLQPVVVERTNQLSTVMRMVASGHGVSIVPEEAFKKEGLPGVVSKELRVADPTRKIIAVVNPFRYQSKLVDHLCDALIADDNLMVDSAG